jgi:O-acetyl-ADP-ribose deacetylase (regulator of RNase III)
MPTSFVKGDLFEDEPGVSGLRGYAFAADCTGAMDRGIAVAFKKRWPELEIAYRARAAGGKMQLADVFAWRDPASDRIVYALGIQQGAKKAKVSTLARALEAMVARATEDGVTRIVLPRIGAGKGGIDRVRVKKVLTEAGAKTPIGLVVFEQFVRSKADAAAPE